MKDIGHEQTEEILKEIEKRISEEYAKAEKEIAKKLDDYLEKFRVKDALKQKAVDNGLITEEEYKQWRVGQIMMGQRWAEMRDSLAKDFTNADKIARSIAYDHMPEVYAINHDYGTFQVEKGSMMDTSYTLYDRNAFEQLVKDEDTFIPAPGRKVSRDIKEGKAMAWNKKQVQSVMMQGLLQGESIPNLATRLAKTVGESDRKAAIRNARTMTTGVQNAGRVASYDRANDMGIETRKQWLATLDNRTRHWHASLDGVTVDNDEPFENEYGEIMYPGDPSADPTNIFNCRCTLIASIKGFERDVSNTDLRHDDHLKDMSYEEWREGHYEQTSEPITRQEEISEQIKSDYIQDYIDINASIPNEVREGFDKFEDKYSNAKTEHYIAYDKDGNVIFESSNKGKTNVSVPKYIDEQNEGGYSIHNHPAEATFSVQDIRNYERYGQNGLVCDIEGNEYVLLNSNPSVDNLVKNAKTEDEVAELMPFSTAANKAFTEIDNDIMTRRREYSKELMATETDGSVRSAKMREWMAENNPEDLKNAWLEENAEKYGFEFVKQKLKGEGIVPLSRIYVTEQSDSLLYSNLKKVKPLKGFDDFGGHGGKDFIERTSAIGVVTKYSAKEFADILKYDEEYSGGNIRLLFCKTGASEKGFAQQLADELGVTVLAPTETLWVDENGKLFVTNNDKLAEMWYNGNEVKETGKMMAFKPKRKGGKK